MKIRLLLFILMIKITNITYCWYQDIVINGQIVEHGERSGLPTYEFLKKVFNLYKRPFSVLDIGAAQGFFSFMTAHDYDATCVMVEGDYDYTGHTDKLLDLCQKNTDLDKMIFLKKLVDLDFLKNMSDCEHFDVTLALNFVHHSGLDWKKTIDLLTNMGDNLILENPPSDELNISEKCIKDRSGIDKYMQELGAVVIGEVERFNKSISKSKIWWLHKPKKVLNRRHIYWPPPEYIGYKDNGKYHLIDSNFETKSLVKKISDNEIRSNWINGINLVTFLAFNGVYPYRNTLAQEVNNLKCNQSNDWGMANMIVAGNHLHLIDKEDFMYQNNYHNLMHFIENDQILTSKIYWCINQNCPILNALIHKFSHNFSL